MPHRRAVSSPSALDRVFLLAILACATGLRLFRIDWGLPEWFFRDESLFFLPAAKIAATGELHTGMTMYPALVPNLLAAVYKMVAVVRHAPNAVLGVADLVLWGRLLMAAASIVTVATVVWLGRAAYDHATGLLAGLFFTVLPLHVTQSHIVSTDVIMTLLVVLTLCVALGIGDPPDRRRLFLSSALAGLAAAAKYPGGLVAVAPALAALRGVHRAVRAGDRQAVQSWLLTVPLMACVALAAFTLGYPSWIQDYTAIRADFAYLGWVCRHFGLAVARLAPSGVRGTPIVYQLVILFPAALGLPLYLLGLAGLARMAWRPSKREATLLGFAVLFFLFFATAECVFPRYYLPICPVLSVAAAHFVVVEARRQGRRGALAVAVAAATVGYTFALSFSLTAHSGLRSQETLRAALERQLAARSGDQPTVARLPEEIGDYTGLGWALRGLAIRETPLVLQRARVEQERPDFVIVSQMHEIVTLRNTPRSEAARTLEALAKGALPYRLVADIRVGYLTSGFYAWLDPYFGVAYERGAVGFRMYALSAPVAGSP